MIWKVGMLVLILCLVASIGIAAYRLATTPTEILGGGFRGLSAKQAEIARQRVSISRDRAT